MYLQLTDPETIARQSRSIIASLVGDLGWSEPEREVVYRVVHASGDPLYARLLKFSPQAAARGVEALGRGGPVVTDVEMVRSGISKPLCRALGVEVLCAVHDPQVQERARLSGRTRALEAIRYLGPRLAGAVVAVGNAPTALDGVLELAAGGQVPALVVGVPVGFVGAAEIKGRLAQSPLPHITVPGSRGGSTVAVAVVNALLHLACRAREEGGRG